MTVRITDTDRGASALVSRLRNARGSRVKVGILDDARKDAGEGRDPGPLSLVEVALIQEFGAGNVPPRSFVRATVDEFIEDIRSTQHALAVQVFKGSTTLPVALDRLGAKVAAMMQSRIARGIDPPNAPSTVAAKGSSKPLVDTGQLKAALTWKVET